MSDTPAAVTPQVTETNRLREIKERYQDLDEGPWQWRQSYEVGSRVYWALESPKSTDEGRVVSLLLILRHWSPALFGESVEDDPYLCFIAHSRDDMEWLVERVAELSATIATQAARIETLRADVGELTEVLSDCRGQLRDMGAKRVAQAARIAELEQALAAATAWVPVEDGMIYHYTDSIPAEWNYPAHTESIEFLEVRDNGTAIACGSMPEKDEHEANLPRNIRLCRAVEDEPVTVPAPDWSQAPSWAQWWAVDGSGATWFEYEPIADRAGDWTVGEDWRDMGQWLNAVADVDIPLGIDWRTLKMKRPDATPPTGQA